MIFEFWNSQICFSFVHINKSLFVFLSDSWSQPLQTDAELERQKRELEVEHQRRLAALREDAEAELRTQLRRQAAAHSDHLADVLSVQVRY